MPTAEGLYLEDSSYLEGAAHGDPPTDPEAAAQLLLRWMRPRLDDKPEADWKLTTDAAGFLGWLSRDVGGKAYQLVKQRDPEAAAEIRRQVLVICSAAQNRYERLSGVGMAMVCARSQAKALQKLPEQVLGAADAVF